MAIVAVFLLTAGFLLAAYEREVPAPEDAPPLSSAEVAEEVPAHREPPPPPPPPPLPPPPPAPRAPLGAGGPPNFEVVCPPVAAPGLHPSIAPPPLGLDPYRHLGAWIDLFDYAIRDCLDPVAAVDELARQGVTTLYLQTGRWKQPQDIVWPEAVDLFLDRAHLRGIWVVGWYVPGFGDLERDLRRSLAVLDYQSPQGHRFDGFAPDIETREELLSLPNSRDAWNAAIVEYSKRLREAAPPGTVLGAIVVDAKNNQRAAGCGSPYDAARCRWHGFPWPEIAHYYDAIQPMAYWTVTKGRLPGCLGVEYDAAAYLREMVARTEELMGASKPLHVIGGIADCATVPEVTSYVGVLPEVGSIGGSIYDFATTETNPGREGLWAQLSRLRR